jgi:hypothetical protein
VEIVSLEILNASLNILIGYRDIERGPQDVVKSQEIATLTVHGMIYLTHHVYKRHSGCRGRHLVCPVSIFTMSSETCTIFRKTLTMYYETFTVSRDVLLCPGRHLPCPRDRYHVVQFVSCMWRLLPCPVKMLRYPGRYRQSN